MGQDLSELPGGYRPERNPDMPNTTANGQEDGSGVGAHAAEPFTVEQLAEISQNPDPVRYDLAGDRAALVPEMRKGRIVTRDQITAFLANVCQETDRLKTLEEYGDEAYFRSFLGDEWRYHGRGYIMLTWRRTTAPPAGG